MSTFQERQQLLRHREQQLMEEICRQEGLRSDFLAELLELERDYLGYRRRRYFHQKMDEAFERELARRGPT